MPLSSAEPGGATGGTAVVLGRREVAKRSAAFPHYAAKQLVFLLLHL